MKGRAGAVTLMVTAALAVGTAGASPAFALQQAQGQIVSAVPVTWTPNVLDGKVEAIAQVGSTVVIGGTFTQIQAASGGPVLTRNGIAALDATTGAISTTFHPSMGGEVTAIVPAGDGASVFVGGYFNSVDGATARKVARLDVDSGVRVSGFSPPAINGNVQDLRLLRDQLVVAGAFTTVGGVTRGQLASLDATTGTLTGFVQHTFAGPRNGGHLVVSKIDVTPAGDRLLGIGNFSTVDGQPRGFIFLLGTSGAQSTLSTWQTDFFHPACLSRFDTYMRDLDISPDGSYAVVSTTGAYGGYTNTPCDSTTRWDLTSTAAGLQPVWQDFTGGDTTYAVAVTGSAVYVGGHMRWENNPYAGDAQGPGGVPRQGIAALDPATGLPLSWNPGRARGVGVFDFLATSTGLWVGDDTTRIANRQHARLAFFPLAGGTAPPAGRVGSLPGRVYLLGSPSTASDPSVLYRVDAGGPALQSVDDGPDWAADQSDPSPYRNNGSNAASYSPSVTSDGSVPDGTLDRAPLALFDTERWDPSGGDEMQWHFPVPSGTHVTVRLYLANRYAGTANPGQRVFSIQLDGATVAADLDLSADPGTGVGTMKAFDTTSDGSVDITFVHQVENPLVDAIEIIDDDVTPGTGGLGAADAARSVQFDGTNPPSGPSALGSSVAWGQARGSFLVDSTLYSGWSDGTLQARTFNGTSFGPAASVPLYGSTFIGDLPNVTGITYANDRVYYTLFGSDALYWRWFTPESSLVGAIRYTVGGDVSAMRPSRVAGMFTAADTVYFADRSDGHLYSVQMSGAGGSQSDPGTVSGPAQLVDSSIDWRSRGAVVGVTPGGGVGNQPPVAAFTTACNGLTCAFDGSASHDPDGTVTSYEWTFGGGQTAAGESVQHSFATAGTYPVTLVVHDDGGAQASVDHDVTVSVTTSPGIAFRASASAQMNSTTHRVTVPASVQAGDVMLVLATSNNYLAVTQDPSGWTLVGERAAGQPDMRTRLYERIATSGDAGSTVTVTYAGTNKADLTVVAYSGVDTGTPLAGWASAADTTSRAAHTTPATSAPAAGDWVVSYWADKTSAATGWTAPASTQQRDQSVGSGGGRITSLLVDSGGPVPSGPVGGLTATSSTASAKATMWTVVLQAA